MKADFALSAPPAAEVQGDLALRFSRLGGPAGVRPNYPPGRSSGRDGVVIVNWQAWQDTLECVASILPSWTPDSAPTVIVDNGSTNESVVQLRQGLQRLLGDRWHDGTLAHTEGTVPRGERAVLLRSEVNRGFAAGNNIALRFYEQHDAPEYVWLLNSDAVAEPGAQEELRLAARSFPDVDLWGATIVDYTCPQRVQCVAGSRFRRYWSLSQPAGAGAARSGLIAGSWVPRVDFISGAAMYARFASLRRAGFLDERLFLYFEELDLIARTPGCQLGWARRAVVAHKGGQSAGSRSAFNPVKSALSEYHSNRSAIIYYRTHHPRLRWLVLPLRFLLKLVSFMRPGGWRLGVSLVRAYCGAPPAR